MRLRRARIPVADRLPDVRTTTAEGRRLTTGEVVGYTDWDRLTAEQKEVLMVQGVDRFNAWLKEKRKKAESVSRGVVASKEVDVKVSKVKVAGVPTALPYPVSESGERLEKVGRGEYMLWTDYRELDRESRKYIGDYGVTAYNKKIEREAAQFKKDNYQLKTGEWVDKAEYVKLSTSEKSRLSSMGVTAYNKKIEREAAQFKKDNYQLKTGEWVDKQSYLELSTERKLKLNKLGVGKFNEYYRKEHAVDVMRNVYDPKYQRVYPQYEAPPAEPPTISERIVSHLRPPEPSQTELKSMYDARQKLPKWEQSFLPIPAATQAKWLYENVTGNEAPAWLQKAAQYVPSLVVKTPRGYALVIQGEAPPVGGWKSGASKGIKSWSKTLTISPKEIGMSETQFTRFIRARVLNPKLTPSRFKVTEALKSTRITPEPIAIPKMAKAVPVSKAAPKVKPAIDWGAKPVSVSGINKLDPGGFRRLAEPVKIAGKSETRVQRLARLDRESKEWAKDFKRIYSKEAKPTPKLPEVAPARINKARLNTIVTLEPSKALRVMIADRSIVNAMATEPLTVLDIMARAGIKARNEALSKFDNKVIDALSLGNLAKVKTEAMTQTKVDTAVDVATKSMTEQAVGVATKLKLQGLTQAETEAAIRTQLKTAIKTVTNVATRTKLKQMVDQIVASSMAIKLGKPVKPIKPIKTTGLIRLPMPDGDVLTLTDEQAKSIIAWKQGIMYKMIWSPYGKDNIYNSRKPLAGVKYYKGVGSASRSAIARGVPQETIKRDMGIVDIEITTAKGGKPVIAYAPDPMQQTRTTPHKKPKPTKKSSQPRVSTIRGM